MPRHLLISLIPKLDEVNTIRRFVKFNNALSVSEMTNTYPEVRVIRVIRV